MNSNEQNGTERNWLLNMPEDIKALVDSVPVENINDVAYALDRITTKLHVRIKNLSASNIKETMDKFIGKWVYVCTASAYVQVNQVLSDPIAGVHRIKGPTIWTSRRSDVYSFSKNAFVSITTTDEILEPSISNDELDSMYNQLRNNFATLANAIPTEDSNDD